MNTLLTYLLESSLITALLYLPYGIVLRRNTFFQLNRLYLLSVCGMALLFPLLNFSLSIPGNNILPQIKLDEVTISADRSQYLHAYTGSLSGKVSALYISGTFIFIILFLQKTYAVFRLIRRHRSVAENGIHIVTVEKGFAPASFFNYVFISANDIREEILVHEKAHVDYRHSIDVLILEIILVFFWFNPVIWVIRASMRNIHEFQADEAILKKGYNRCRYQSLVFENCFGVQPAKLAVNFNNSPIKKRLIMMTKNKDDKRKKWLYVPAVLLACAAFFYVGCEHSDTGKIEAGDNQPTIVTEDNMIPPPPPPPPPSASAAETENIENQDKEDLFIIVEEMPTFNGEDLSSFKNYVTANLNYPEKAIAEGIEGEVTVQFVISTTGELTDIKITKSVDPLLDKEVLRVINESPLWEPGKQRGEKVRVQATFPVTFKL